MASNPHAVCALVLTILPCSGLSLPAEDQPIPARYTIEPAGRIETITTPEGTTRYNYFPDGLISAVQYPDGTRETFKHEDVSGALRLVEALRDPSSPARNVSPFQASANRFLFTGHYYDTETGLYYAKARYYDPALGRFITQDTYFGEIDDPPSLHRFTYANDNPTRYVDPTGHFSVEDFLKGAVNVVMEPFRQVSDVIVAGVATHGMDIDAEDVQLSSMLGKAQHQRVVEGQRPATAAVKGVGETALAVGTVGIGPAALSHYELATAFGEGRITIDEYDAALSELAGGQTAGAALAAVAAKASSPLRHGKGAEATVVMEGGRHGGTVDVPMGLSAEQTLRLTHPHDPSVPGPRPLVAPAGGSQGADASLGQRPAPSSAAARSAPQAERLAGSKLEHMNAAIAEQHGYTAALEKGQIGIQGPGKATARGPDYVTFDPRRGDVVVWDSKYRGSTGGSAPSTVPATKLQRWAPEVKAAIEAMPDGPAKAAAQAAFQAGKIRGEVFKWPQ